MDEKTRNNVGEYLIGMGIGKVIVELILNNEYLAKKIKNLANETMTKEIITTLKIDKDNPKYIKLQEILKKAEITPTSVLDAIQNNKPGELEKLINKIPYKEALGLLNENMTDKSVVFNKINDMINNTDIYKDLVKHLETDPLKMISNVALGSDENMISLNENTMKIVNLIKEGIETPFKAIIMYAKDKNLNNLTEEEKKELKDKFQPQINKIAENINSIKKATEQYFNINLMGFAKFLEAYRNDNHEAILLINKVLEEDDGLINKVIIKLTNKISDLLSKIINKTIYTAIEAGELIPVIGTLLEVALIIDNVISTAMHLLELLGVITNINSDPQIKNLFEEASKDYRPLGVKQQIENLKTELNNNNPKKNKDIPAITQQPTATQPTATQPTATQPTATQPTASQPTSKPTSKPTATQPTATQPTSKPTATQPIATTQPTTTGGGKNNKIMLIAEKINRSIANYNKY
jgi:hypothetical protein